MFSLFVKDFYLIRKHLWVAMFYSFLMFVIFNSQGFETQNMVYTVGTTMIGYTMIMYTTAYDDKNNSEVLLNSLPISRSLVVLSRYLSVFLFSLIGVFSMIIAGFVLKSFNVLNVTELLRIEDFIGAIVALSIISFLYLPIYFKFGYIKTKMFNLVLFALGFGGPVVLGALLKGTEKPLWIDKFVLFLNSQSTFVIGLFLIIIIIVLGLISYGVSVINYRKREF